MIRQRLFALASVWLVACTATAPGPVPAAEPWRHGGMVSAANPYAVAAAAEILAAGGHAVDAAIAAHAVLGLVEPQSSGLGGGAFMLVYERASGEVRVYDGRETAPAGTTAELFLEDGAALGFVDAWQSGLSVGVPGTVALYAAAHQAHGRRPWAEVLQPAIALAEAGFVVSPRLHGLLKRVARVSQLDDHPESAAYFYPGGEALAVGARRKNPDYAETLRRVASEGVDAFYTGPLARAMAAAAQAPPRGGRLTAEDIGAYRVRVREPVCGDFLAYTLCSAPPPSSGLAQIAIAGLYERFTRGSTSDDEGERLRAFVDAQRLAYADRDHYVADPAFAAVPTAELIDPRYLDQRAGERFAPAAPATPGDPGRALRDAPLAEHFGRDSTHELAGTTHLSVIDVYGNGVALTASVEAPFGSARWVGGFLLNNQLTDFARDPRAEGPPPANVPAPGKRPRSSMSPTLVFDANRRL
ncbi:MAG: gamma-glutamyltransferase, partial [Proteobacteria bacterium]|nr:gamma-glutamyltransferase [Pseudomonadota bacterium]